MSTRYRPAMTDAGLRPTCPVTAVDEFGDTRDANIAGERPLTLYVDKRELVTLMEDAVIALLAEHDIEACARREAPGVYVGDAKIAALGLRHHQMTVEHDDTPAIRGMLHKVRHLVRVEEVE